MLNRLIFVEVTADELMMLKIRLKKRYSKIDTLFSFRFGALTDSLLFSRLTKLLFFETTLSKYTRK